MNVAFSVWNKRISPLFDVSRQIFLLEVSAGGVVSRRTEELPGADPLSKVKRLVELDVQTLVCGAVSRYLAEEIIASGIELVPFVAGEIEEVIAAYLSGSLPDSALAMPGCCRRRRMIRMGRCLRGEKRPAGYMPDIEYQINKRKPLMPQGDGTGPRGQGPETGRGLGSCRGPRGRGLGQGKGHQPGETGKGSGRGRGR